MKICIMGSVSAQPTFQRLDWGGIIANEAGREALCASAQVLRWLAKDYENVPGDAWLSIVRTLEAVECAIGREAEARALEETEQDL